MKQGKDQSVKIMPLGGLDAIGKNMTVFEYGEDIIVVDCGIKFPTEETPGIDFIIPDFSYIVKNRNRIKGIIITHGHEDHIGAVPFLLKEVSAPVFALRLTLGLIQSRLEERPPRQKPTFIEVTPGNKMQVGAFVIEFIRVNHSIIDGAGIAIGTPVGTIIHSGDFKIDYSPVDGRVTDIYKFAEYGENGVLLLMSDSTNALRKGYTRSESILSERLFDIFSSVRGRIIVATFASNIHRIQQVLDAAQKYNKRVVISGITMLKNVEIARSLGYLEYHDDLVVDVSEANSLPAKKLVIICTGSQGEPMSALSRMASNTHRHFVAGSGDTVIITASVIPGNERMVYTVINSLMRMGTEVYYEQDEDLHVSGHASQEELKLMISLTKPKFFMPIHGEYRHLRAHARIAESLGIKPARILIAANGDILELSKKGFEKTGELNLDQIYVDGQDIEDVGNGVIRDRKSMSAEGIVMVTVVTAEGMLVRPPEIVAKGFVAGKNVKVIDSIRTDVQAQVHRMLADGAQEKEITIFLRKHLKNSIFRLTRRNPLIEVQVMDV